MKFKLFSLLAGATLFFVGKSSAATYSSFVELPTTGYFDIVAEPDLISTDIKYTGGDILNASVVFNFSNNDYPAGDPDIATVTVGTQTTPVIFISTVGFAVVVLDSTDIADLMADGRIEYSVNISSGSSLAVSAVLTATGPDTPVPDNGSSVALLGLGMIGLAGASKKLRAKNNA